MLRSGLVKLLVKRRQQSIFKNYTLTKRECKCFSNAKETAPGGPLKNGGNKTVGLAVSLFIGYFVYRKILQMVMIKNNLHLTKEQHEELKLKNFTMINKNRLIMGNPVNQKSTYKREKIVIIGSGVIGATSAYYLTKNKDYEVILIEKNDAPGLETSYKNGCIFCPSLTYPWVNQSLFKHFIAQYFDREYPMNFSFKCLLDKYMLIWIFNMFVSLLPSRVEKSFHKSWRLGILGHNELNKLLEDIPADAFDHSAQGTLELFQKEEAYEHERKIYETKKNKGCPLEVLSSKELYELEPELRLGKVKYEKGVLLPRDSNINTFKFTNSIVEHCENQGNFSFLTDTKFEEFVFDQNGKVVGILTNAGVIRGDKFVVACGNHTKSVTDKLGVRTPIAHVKGYTLTIPHPEKKLKYNLTDDSSKIYVTQIGDSLRVSGTADFRGIDYEIYPNRIKLLVKGAKEMVGDLNEKEMEMWTGFRPVSPDDVPIVGKLPTVDNVYINAGHGSKGTTQSLGSARILYDIITGEKKIENVEDFSLNRFYFV